MNKALYYGVVAIVGLGVLGIGFSLAHGSEDAIMGSDGTGKGGGYERMMERKAEILGLDADQLIADRESGKTFEEIIAESGIAKEDFQVKMRESAEARLNDAVANGTITEAEAQEKLQAMEERHNSGDCSGPHQGGMKQGLRIGSQGFQQ